MRGLASAFLLLATTASAEDFTTLKGHGGPIMGLAVSPAGQVASASFDNAVGVWDGRTPTWLDGHEAAVIAVEWVDNQTLISGGDDFAVRIWDTAGGRELLRHQGKVTDIAVSPEGNIIASASWDGTIGLSSVDRMAPVFIEHYDGGLNDLAFNADGSRLYAASSGGDILVFDIAFPDRSPRVLVRHGFAINELVLAPDEAWLAYGAVDGVTRVIDPDTGGELRDFSLDRRPILAMVHHPGTGQLAVGDGHGFIMMIDTTEWRIDRDFRATRKGPVWALAYSPDGQTIWAGGLDEVVNGWPVALMEEFEPAMGQERTFLRDVDAMPNGERQFMRKCSICHAVSGGTARKAGPTLAGLFGRLAGTVTDYAYSDTLNDSTIVWNGDTIDALFDQGPDHYIPGSKMPMQRIARPEDRRDLIEYLRSATRGD